MASLFRPRWSYYALPDGTRCARGAPGAVRHAGQSAVWWGRWTDRAGKRRQVKLSTRKKEAADMLADLVSRSNRADLGLADRYEQHRARPLAQHVEDYRRYLAARGNVADYVAGACSRVLRVAAECGWARIGDVSPSALVELLARLREGGIGVVQSNHYLTAAKGFSRWLVRDGRAERDPLEHLSRLNPDVDRRHKRRALRPEEVSRLLLATADGPVVCGLTGRDRAMLYVAAVNTGLRASELASLTPASFQLDANPPTVTVAAGYSKHRREDVQPLRQDVASMLRGYLASRPNDGPLWPGRWRLTAAAMLRADLAAAAIPYRDAQGRVCDFHALRHTFVSSLAAGGIHPKVAQTLARHSTITLTMDCYSHTDQQQVAGALDKLPGVGPRKMEETGKGEENPPKDRPAA